MNTKILMSLVTIGLVASIIGVGSYAYFSDTELARGNTILAGVLDLWVNNQNPVSGPVVTITDMKPSYQKWSSPVVLRIENNSGKLYKMIYDVECVGNDHPEAEEAEDPSDTINNIDDYTDFAMNVDGKRLIDVNQSVQLNDVVGMWICLGLYPPEVDVPVKQYFHLHSDVTNWAQGDQCTFKEKFLVLQNISDDPDTNPNDPYYAPVFNHCQPCLTGNASSVHSFLQGPTNDNSSIRSGRSNPSNALKFESGSVETNFFSLGFTGWIVLEYEYPIVNRAGNDVRVVEDTWGTYPIESAAIYASQDASTWTFLGNADNADRDPIENIHTIDDFDLGSLAWAKYIKVVDTTPLSNFPKTSYPGADGFDLNAVMALPNC